MGLIDTHNHLYFDRFDADRDEAIARMAQAGVTGAVVVGIDPATIPQARALAEAHPQLAYSAGLHPTSPFGELCRETAPGQWAFDAAVYFEPWFSSTAAPVAIGECGIDLHWDVNPLAAQQAVFRAQLELARERNLPVIIHTRDADAETLGVLESVAGTRGVLHCFNGSPALLQFALARPRWYVSFAGNVSFPKATALHEAALAVPSDRLLVETDAPFIAPQPVRGQRCEPAHVVHTAAALAALRGSSLEELAPLLLENARACFGVDWT